jgi:uncharacterized membrane protein YkoI
MKNIRTFLISGALALGMVCAASSCSADKAEKKSTAVASIRPTGKVQPADLPGLAKISMEVALKAALDAAPGKVIKAELEVEDGNLQYSFDVVGADGKIKEVEIDAGNGKVLDID